MKLLKKAACLILCGAILLTAFMPLMAFAEVKEEAKVELKFNENGEFKILAIADPQDTDTPQKETIEVIEKALDRTNPDLVVFLGDNIAGWWKGVDKEQTAAAIRKVIAPIDSRGIPFAIVYGNHDHEGLADENNRMTEEEAKEFQLAVYQEYPTCLAIEGEEMTGCGNYNLLIKNSSGTKDVFNLWLMDSNPYAEEGGYGYVQPDQTEWYIRTSDELKEANGGTPLPSLLFQHIPVPEVYELAIESKNYKPGYVKGSSALYPHFYKASDAIVEGAFNEGPCPADVAHNQFETWKQQGDIIGAFFGHDHVNDYLGKLDGIWLCAVPAAGYYSYGNNHGVRTITLHENDLSTFETELIYADNMLDYKVTPTYKNNHGFYEYQHRFIPAVIGSAIGGAVLLAAGIGIATILKKKKNTGNK